MLFEGDDGLADLANTIVHTDSDRSFFIIEADEAGGDFEVVARELNDEGEMFGPARATKGSIETAYRFVGEEEIPCGVEAFTETDGELEDSIVIELESMAA